MIKEIKKKMNISVSIGVSSAYKDIARSKSSLSEAKEAFYYSYYLGNEKVFFYTENFFAGREQYRIPEESEEQLWRALKAHDIDRINAELERIFDDIRTKRLLPQTVFPVFFDIVQYFRNEARKYDVDIQCLCEGRRDIYGTIMEFDTLESAQNWFKRLSNAFCNKLLSGIAPELNENIRKLINYIYKNYARPLSLKEASEFLHMSEAYLCRFFKKETGKNLTEFVSDVRLDAAKELLRTTDLTAYQIAEKVGYENPNYFIRLFKKKLGINFSEYRRLDK